MIEESGVNLLLSLLGDLASVCVDEDILSLGGESSIKVSLACGMLAIFSVDAVCSSQRTW